MTKTQLRREILLKKKMLAKVETEALAHETFAKRLREDWLKQSMVVAELQEQLLVEERLEEDLAGKHGPIVDLSIGQHVIVALDYASKQWPKTTPCCRIKVSPLGRGHRSARIVDFRPYMLSADTLSNEDIKVVLAAIESIPEGPEFLEYLHSWATPNTFIELAPGELYRLIKEGAV